MILLGRDRRQNNIFALTLCLCVCAWWVWLNGRWMHELAQPLALLVLLVCSVVLATTPCLFISTMALARNRDRVEAALAQGATALEDLGDLEDTFVWLG